MLRPGNMLQAHSPDSATANNNHPLLILSYCSSLPWPALTPASGLCLSAFPPFFLQFEPAQVSRFLVSLGASGLPVTLALNKADLLPAQEIQARIDQVRTSAWEL